MKMIKATYAALFSLTGLYGVSSDADAMQTQTHRVIYRSAPVVRAAPVRPPVRMSRPLRTVRPAPQIFRPAFNYHQSHTVFSGHGSNFQHPTHTVTLPHPSVTHLSQASHSQTAGKTPSLQGHGTPLHTTVIHPPLIQHGSTPGKTPSFQGHGTPPHSAVPHPSLVQHGPVAGKTESLQGHGTPPHTGTAHPLQAQHGPGPHTPQPPKSDLQAKGPMASNPNAKLPSRIHQREEAEATKNPEDEKPVDKQTTGFENGSDEADENPDNTQNNGLAEAGKTPDSVKTNGRGETEPVSEEGEEEDDALGGVEAACFGSPCAAPAPESPFQGLVQEALSPTAPLSPSDARTPLAGPSGAKADIYTTQMLPWQILSKPNVRRPEVGAGRRPISEEQSAEIGYYAESVANSYQNRHVTYPVYPKDANGKPIVKYPNDRDASCGGDVADCSHFVHDVLVHSGLNIPYETPVETMTTQGIKKNNPNFTKVSPAQARAGDIIVRGGHMGIFSGAYDAGGRPIGTQMGDHGVKDVTWGPDGDIYAGDSNEFYRPNTSGDE